MVKELSGIPVHETEPATQLSMMGLGLGVINPIQGWVNMAVEKRGFKDRQTQDEEHPVYEGLEAHFNPSLTEAAGLCPLESGCSVEVAIEGLENGGDVMESKLLMHCAAQRFLDKQDAEAAETRCLRHHRQIPPKLAEVATEKFLAVNRATDAVAALREQLATAEAQQAAAISEL